MNSSTTTSGQSTRVSTADRDSLAALEALLGLNAAPSSTSTTTATMPSSSATASAAAFNPEPSQQQQEQPQRQKQPPVIHQSPSLLLRTPPPPSSQISHELHLHLQQQQEEEQRQQQQPPASPSAALGATFDLSSANASSLAARLGGASASLNPYDANLMFSPNRRTSLGDLLNSQAAAAATAATQLFLHQQLQQAQAQHQHQQQRHSQFLSSDLVAEARLTAAASFLPTLHSPAASNHYLASLAPRSIPSQQQMQAQGQDSTPLPPRQTVPVQNPTAKSNSGGNGEDNISNATTVATPKATVLADLPSSGSSGGLSFSMAAAACAVNDDNDTIGGGEGVVGEVRSEKVKEALRSKPQRGKKRDDLSESERIELTRTRNREHAKSTRVRKKARYQELLDCEEEYKKLKDAEDLRAERAGALQRFLVVRQAMLNGHFHQKLSSIPGDAVIAESLDSTSTIAVQSMTSMIDQERGLHFDVQDSKFSQSPATPKARESRTTVSLSRMAAWDKYVSDRAALLLGRADSTSTTPPLLSFELEDGGMDGIAISSTGTALARVRLVCKTTPTESVPRTEQGTTQTLLLTGLLSVTFAGESSQVSTATWTPLQNELPDLPCNGGKMPKVATAVANASAESSTCTSSNLNEDDNPSSSSTSSENLGDQLVHPSVVSLDHDKMTSADATDDQQGPGMSI